jgi:hypothetical protein
MERRRPEGGLLGDLCKATRPLPRGTRAHPAGRGGGEGKKRIPRGGGGKGRGGGGKALRLLVLYAVCNAMVANRVSDRRRCGGASFGFQAKKNNVRLIRHKCSFNDG